MSDREITSKIVDEVLRYGVGGAVLATGIFLPGAIVGLEKPLKKMLAHLDDRERARELRRVIYYMKDKGYLAGEYEHGLQLTEKAKKRISRLSDDEGIQPQVIWDGVWRVVLYDIPEEHRNARWALTAKLHQIGCFQLQKSTWITPFSCRDLVLKITSDYEINKYVTYFEANYLENDQPLLTRFAKKYPQTRFH
ncbi:MAG: hypothetical protein WBO35_06120 [Candidatus Saccharimonadales bacterium]